MKIYFLKKAIALFVLLSSYQLISSAQILEGKEAQEYIKNAQVVRLKNGTISFARFDKAPPIHINTFTEAYLLEIFKLNTDFSFQITKTEQDQIGFTHISFKQYYKGIMVDGATYKAHFKEGYLVSINGEYHAFSLNTTAGLSAQQVLTAALSFVNAEVYKWEILEEEQVLKYIHKDQAKTYYPNPQLVVKPNLNEGTYMLAYKMKVYAHEPMSHQLLYIDANTGDVLQTIDQIHTVDSVGTAMTAYIGTQPITADFTGANFRLRETGRGTGVETYDMNTGTNYGTAVDFTDGNNVWNNVNAAQDEYATDAHLGTEMTYDYYLNEHGRNSIDDNGFLLVNYIHYNNNYNNAFWDGTRMTYGDGNGAIFNPLTSIDVAAHEMTHGLTSYTADLVYSAQSGALNESFSDIFGNSVESLARPINWRIGEDITVAAGAGIRNMANPNTHGDPDTYQGTNWVPTGGPCHGGNDNCGVHTNSGVQNFWYYLLVNGGSGTNDNSDAYNVTGIGLSSAGKIAFRNLTIYLGQNSNYADARFYAIQSARDLFGDCSQEVISTTNAWYAVGVGAPWTPPAIAVNFTADPATNCFAPVTVQFTNQTLGANSFIWKFGDGTTSTEQSPCHVYDTLGTYNVELVADGAACGNLMDSLLQTSFIDIAGGNACNLRVPLDGQGCVQTACSGTLFDNGGAGADYPNLSTAWMVIEPPGASSVTLTFNSFNYEQDWDYFYIYDGNSRNAPLIGSYTGTGLPGGGTITSTGGAITVLSYSDPFVTELGFDLDWTCTIPVLATDFLTFDAEVAGQDVLLRWEVSTTLQADEFIVQRSTNGKDYVDIGTIKRGKSTAYSYLDEQPTGSTIYYMVVARSSAQEVISRVAQVHISKKEFSFSVFPNPSAGQFMLNMEGDVIPNASVNVFDALGKLVYSAVVDKNSRTLPLDLSHLKKGLYLIQIEDRTVKVVIE